MGRNPGATALARSGLGNPITPPRQGPTPAERPGHDLSTAPHIYVWLPGRYYKLQAPTGAIQARSGNRSLSGAAK